MKATIREHIEQVIGQMCCRQHIGDHRSLRLGFGEIVRVKTARGEADYGKWEIGTYHCAWRIIHDQKIVCGSQDVVESIDELRRAISVIKWGRCSAIRQLTDMDVRVEFDNGVFVDILATISDEDEVLHLFCPDKVVVTFSIPDGWVAGPSDKPWGNQSGHR